MKRKLLFGWMIFALVCGVNAFAQTRDVTFQVDMSVQIGKGKFSHGNSIDVRGPFNGWAGTAMTRDGMTDVYQVTITVTGAPNTSAEYKYHAADWESISGNRSFQLGPANTPQTLPVDFYNNEEEVGNEVQADVTFSVNMSVEIAEDRFDPEGDKDVVVRGEFNSWGTSSVLTREGNSSIYSGTFNVSAEENSAVEYKFFYFAKDNSDVWESLQANRSFIMGGGSSQVLATVYFNDVEPVAVKDLEFTSGTWNPSTLDDYEFELTRQETNGQESIVLSSDNEAAVTVPAFVWFDDGSNKTVFLATVVSLTNGDATITASNTLTGASDSYTVRAPTLSVTGPQNVYAAGTYQYTVTRFAGITDTVNLQSSDTGVMTVPATLSFTGGVNEATFSASGIGAGQTTLTVTDPANGIFTTIQVTYANPHMVLSGPATIPVGESKTYTLTRFGGIGDLVNLASSATGVVTVPATVQFQVNEDVVTFQATAVAAGTAKLSASNNDGDSNELTVTAQGALNVIANDHAGNYTIATFTNGANEGFGFGAWDFWNAPATLGDSTSGGGGDLNSTNGLSFKFGRNAENDWANARRNFNGALGEGDTVSFTFTYNWDGGGRGVDIFDSNGQFANLINVGPGDNFSVNGRTVSTNWSPGAVVEVEITQEAAGIAMTLVRSVGGTPNLNYTTNIANALPATGFSMYCGGYTYNPADEANYAIYMNDLRIVSAAEEPEAPEIEKITFAASSGEMLFSVPTGYSLVAVEGADCEVNGLALDWQALVENTDYTYNIGTGEVRILMNDPVGKLIRVVLAKN